MFAVQGTQLSKPQKRSLKALYSRLPNTSAVSAETFLLRYISFGAVARKLWNYSRKLHKKDANDSHASITVLGLKKALKTFDISVHEAVVTRLLSSDLRNRGSMSARNLRNELVHQWKQEAIDEVVSRLQQLDDDIEQFLHAVKHDGQF